VAWAKVSDMAAEQLNELVLALVSGAIGFGSSTLTASALECSA
jgi:hypothetical protein